MEEPATELRGRALIASEVGARASHRTADEVRKTLSLANAERMFGYEYHGRFLVELLQNAADAWGPPAGDGERSRVEIVLTEGPALLVANQGDPFPAETIIESLGHIGQSTKAKGQAIGHKGIGFKSVLEISLTPEVYSKDAASDEELAVRFDPQEALTAIKGASPDWEALISEIDVDELAIVPVLQFPHWVEKLPEDVVELKDRGFDTVVRVPFRDGPRPDPSLDEEAWLDAVRTAIRQITDQMVLLLGAFEELVIRDDLAGTEEHIRPQWADPIALESEVQREEVTVLRGGEPSSRWRLFRRDLPGQAELEGEVVVGLRIGEDGSATGLRSLAAAHHDELSAPFYLFFPTKIGSGLPFLLHGYFEVNAARTGFYEGATARNRALLDELAELAGIAVGDMASARDIDLASLLDLLGRMPPPEDHLAASFLDRVLTILDGVRWVPLETDGSDEDLGSPTELLVDEDARLIRRVNETFPPSYFRQKTGLATPAQRVSDAGYRFLVSRGDESSSSIWDVLGDLCRPGTGGPWAAGDEEVGFLALLELFAALEVNDRDAASELRDQLRGDPDSVLLPVSSGPGAITMTPLPDPREGVAGRASFGVMARTGDRKDDPPVPPEALRLAFLPEGLLSSETEIDRAKPLGIRPFNVANVLDRLVGLPDAPEERPKELVQFLWALLLRESASEFSVRSSVQRSEEFDPAAWFWSRAGSGSSAEADRETQRRRRSLARVLLPARDGSWRPAGQLAFGTEWADWIEVHAGEQPSSAAASRMAAYRSLEAVRPGEHAMLAPPATLLDLLAPAADVLPANPDDGRVRQDRMVHAFLLSLGVWETLPVEGFDDRSQEGREPFPWASHPLSSLRDDLIQQDGGWAFDWEGREHANVWVSQDFRFSWSLEEAAQRDPRALARLLDVGSDLYSALRSLNVFCRRCRGSDGGHSAPRHSSSSDGFPSILLLELRANPWVPAIEDGEPLADPVPPESVWWSESVPSGPGRLRSPLRYLRLCDPDAGLSDRLRTLAAIADLRHADRSTVLSLLTDLADRFAAGTLPVSPGAGSSERQSFVGLHRLAYERLAELRRPEDRSDPLDGVGVLCELGEGLEYRRAAEAFHDDGDFASYRRYFSGRVPFVEIQPDRRVVARALGVPEFNVELTRREAQVETDVTSEVSELISDRVPELLAIVVHHSLGAQTLEPTSAEFELRARRLQRLRVVQVDDLVIEARVSNTKESTVIGQGSNQELFLDRPTSGPPVIYHDLKGEGWQDRFRRKLAPHLARLLENPAYADTFMVLLLDETDAEREATLLDRGITSADVDAIRVAVGAVSEGERRQQGRWFGALVAARKGLNAPQPINTDRAAEALVEAGIGEDEAEELVRLGGGESVRRDTSPTGALWLVHDLGIDLAEVDRLLRDSGDEGLRIDVGRQKLHEWTSRFDRLAAAALVTKLDPDQAKQAAATWTVPAGLEHVLNPDPSEWLEPVLASLADADMELSASALVEEPRAELARAAGVEEAGLADLAERLYDEKDQVRILAAVAREWRSAVRILGVLARTGPHEGRHAIRAEADAVEALLPASPPSPTSLKASLAEVLPGHASLQEALADRMVDTLTSAPPETRDLLDLAEKHELKVGHFEAVTQALQGPRRELARQVRSKIRNLKERGLEVVEPPGLTPKKPKDGKKKRKRKISAIKVSPATDQRKRKLGDEGERWTLAAVIDKLLVLDPEARDQALDELSELLGHFDGAPVDSALLHAAAAREVGANEDDLIDDLAGFLHVAKYSDEFGFDMLGWLPTPGSDADGPVLVEVKSSSDGSFHLSTGEWARAEEFEERYAVLVVRRGQSGEPKRFDLLGDPVNLAEAGQIAKAADGYKFRYRTGGKTVAYRGR